ncbi:sensor histidine kinase [Flavisolibacter ginsenosidimutans]|uniref:histidine kinase n=1 Tax=Flavisolibacter ginsenosidimutans TaxID=661481 RepID=A0A5B8UPT8_9BACT|nr:PAS domain-containing sensor histidine kinase [Flavisolibacter ginsenosidimutans]QEC58060.1 PAS domain S-box protein [Flavisolibacter ginsenosidimutans]
MMTDKAQQHHPFLNGGGEMGERIRSKDWSLSPLGTPNEWPQSLRTTVSILLNSKFPMFVWWGEDLITIYNDAYCPIAGEKHPSLLGKSGKEGWIEIWEDLGPLVDSVFSGKSTWSEDQALYMNRRGYVEETYFTFSYSPIWDESGTVAGLFCACIETTEKVLATRKIQESERNLRATILQSPVAMCILRGPSFVVEIANDRMYEVWGKGADQMLRRPIFDGLPEVRNQGLEEVLQDVVTSGETFVASERPVQLPRKKSIETIYINFVYEPFREGDGSISGVIAVANDVTEQVLARKRIEESEQELQLRVKERTAELENQKNLLDNILTNSSNGISVTEMIRDEKGKVVDASTILANDAAVRFIGLPRDVYLTKTATEIDPGILSTPYGQTCLHTLATGEPSFIQYFLEMTGRWLELTISRMDTDHLIHIFTDVTPIKETQLQLERLVEDLKRSNANLEDFAYAASHDLKEPIRKIHLFADRLKHELEENLTEMQKHIFERLEYASRRMGTLVDDLLSYSQATRGVPEMEAVDLNKKVQLVLEDLEVEVQQKDATLSVGPLPVVEANRRQMQQLFHNLITNALKYSKTGVSPEIRITSEEVIGKEVKPDLSAEIANKKYYFIQVKDNGIGFAQEDAERIFNVFTRLHGNAEYRGTGVGLSIVRKVVENHHGYVWAESVLEQGATFNILLPV